MNISDLLKTKAGQDPENRARLEQAARDLAGAAPLGALAHPKRQHNLRGKGEDSSLAGVSERLGYRVDIISVRRRPIDEHDNLRTGAKPLADLIAGYLEIDDADPRIKWSYHQLITEGQEGTILKIETVTL